MVIDTRKSTLLTPTKVIVRGKVVDPPKRSRRRTPTTPAVSIRGGQVFIGGQGFSVAPSLQEEFIRSKTGGRGSSAQSAISQARTTEAIRRQESAKELQRKTEAEKAARLKELIKQREQARLAAIELQRIQRQREKIIREGAKKNYSSIYRF